MNCRRCGSPNVQVHFEQSLKNQRHGCLYWLVIGWWLHPILWLFATLPMLLIRIFIPKRQQIKSTKVFICNNCGASWKA